MGSAADSYRRYLEGDDYGLFEIIDLYNESLTLFIKGIVGDFGDAEEIVRDTFAKIALKKPKFGGRSTFKTGIVKKSAVPKDPKSEIV